MRRGFAENSITAYGRIVFKKSEHERLGMAACASQKRGGLHCGAPRHSGRVIQFGTKEPRRCAPVIIQDKLE